LQHPLATAGAVFYFITLGLSLRHRKEKGEARVSVRAGLFRDRHDVTL
jgi:hypothetical protein